MIEVYYWEDDDEAVDLLAELEARELAFEGIILDAEVPTATPMVVYKGKCYEDFSRFTKILDQA